MSWDCPHQNSDFTCDRLKGPCVPTARGCVLNGRADLLGPAGSGGALRVHVLQHVPFEGLGSIGPWLDEREARVTFTRFFKDEAVPDRGAFDLLIALGGPMSVNDEAALPWLRDEKRLIARAVADGKAVLGICLGAQLIASALGARVFPNAQREIGWFPVSAEGPADGFGLPREFAAFHWHGETFDLPPGAVRLARSEACANQAFLVGTRALGLQFHLEVTPASADAMFRHCGAELTPAPFVQSEASLRAVPEPSYAAANALMRGLLERLAARA